MSIQDWGAIGEVVGADPVHHACDDEQSDRIHDPTHEESHAEEYGMVAFSPSALAPGVLRGKSLVTSGVGPNQWRRWSPPGLSVEGPEYNRREPQGREARGEGWKVTPRNRLPCSSPG